jgi:hypothetical protein
MNEPQLVDDGRSQRERIAVRHAPAALARILERVHLAPHVAKAGLATFAALVFKKHQPVAVIAVSSLHCHIPVMAARAARSRAARRVPRKRMAAAVTSGTHATCIIRTPRRVPAVPFVPFVPFEPFEPFHPRRSRSRVCPSVSR